MAIVQAPALSLRASGNLGAICYSTWRGCQVARAKSSLICPMTTPQKKAQDAVGEASVAWSGTLTEAERGQWIDFARSQRMVNRLGLRWTPSGYMMYMKRSVQAILFGGAVQTVPPVEIKSILVDTWKAEASTNLGEVDIEMTFPTGFERPDLVQVFRAGPYDGAGRHAIAPEYLEVQQIADPFQWTDIGLTSAKYYWYRIRWGMLDGVVGTSFYGQVLVT